jgi:hypothetical protein
MICGCSTQQHSKDSGCRLDNEPGSREFPTSIEGRGTSLDAIQDTASKCQRIKHTVHTQRERGSMGAHHRIYAHQRCIYLWGNNCASVASFLIKVIISVIHTWRRWRGADVNDFNQADAIEPHVNIHCLTPRASIYLLLPNYQRSTSLSMAVQNGHLPEVGEGTS